MANFVEIKHFYEPEEAYCARGFLISNGISPTLLGEHHLAVEPWLRIGLGGYRMYVPASQKADAIALLEGIGETDATLETEQELKSIKWKRNWFWLPAAYMYGVPFIPKFGPASSNAIQAVILLAIYIILGEWIISLSLFVLRPFLAQMGL